MSHPAQAEGLDKYIYIYIYIMVTMVYGVCIKLVFPEHLANILLSITHNILGVSLFDHKCLKYIYAFFVFISCVSVQMNSLACHCL